MKSPHRDLALLVSVVGLGLTTAARAQSEAELPVSAEGLQPSDWDWTPPEAILTVAPAVGVAVEVAVEVAAVAEPALAVSDWDWVPGEVPGSVTASAPEAGAPAGKSYEPAADEMYGGAGYTVATLSLETVQRHFEGQRAAAGKAAEEAALLAAVQAFATRLTPEPVALDRTVLAEANDVDPRIASFVHEAMPEFAKADAAIVPNPDAIVVASHADKVLLGLFAVTSDDWRQAGRTTLNPEDVVIGAKPTPLDTLFTLPAIEAPTALAFVPIDAVPEPAPPARKARKPKKAAEPAPRVVVASHVDKVLLSLNTIRAEDAAPLALLEMQPKDVAVSAPEFGGEQLALDSSRLDRVRGGFSDGNLQISFGIQRAVYINGSLVTTTSLNLSSLGQITGGTASLPGSLALIQSGTGNGFFAMPTGNGSVATVIQNTLNNQKIQSVTQIDAVVNSMQILKGMNLQQSLRGAVIDSLRR